MEKYTISKSLHLAEVQVSYKTKVKMSDLPILSQSSDTAKVIREIWDDNKIEYQEEMIMLFLNRRNRVTGWAKISTGGLGATLCDPKVVFSMALAHAASNIIISHNHPSGSPSPSEHDRLLTKKILDGGKILDIKLLDHVIITPEDGYYSFADSGDLY